MSLDRAALNALKGIYTSLPKTVMATGTSWLLCRYVNRLGLDDKTTAIFTAAASALWYGAKAFTADFKKDILSHCIVHIALTYTAKEMLRLDLPLYKQFGKAYGVALAVIFAVNWASSQLAAGKTSRSQPRRQQWD